MIVMNLFTAFDTQLFLLINHLPHGDIANSVAMFLSGIGQRGAIWFVIALCLFLLEEKRNHWFFLPFFLSAGLAFFVSELLIKAWILRPRPTIEIGARIVAGAQNYSFPSTHATVAFALAYVLSREEPRLRVLFYLLAIAIGFSRMYLGVHYPSDVVAGAILGWGIGYGVMFVAQYLVPLRSVRVGVRKKKKTHR
jgi:undecaprenyl-diphosphatase